MLLIGITGLNGSGKTTVAEIIAKNYNFKSLSFREYLIKKSLSKKLKTRTDMINFANELRKKHSTDFIIKDLIDMFCKDKKQNYVFESIRAPKEADFIKNSKGILISVTADAKIRYNRIKKRSSETDNLSFKQFLDDEEKEMQNSDPNKQNLSYCMAVSDYQIENNGSQEDLKREVTKIIKELSLKS